MYVSSPNKSPCNNNYCSMYVKGCSTHSYVCTKIKHMKRIIVRECIIHYVSLTVLCMYGTILLLMYLVLSLELHTYIIIIINFNYNSISNSTLCLI